MSFNPGDRRWKCMCGVVHVTTGAIVLAILGIIVGIISIIGILWMVPICALMLYGVKSERRGFIIPYLVLGILEIIGSIALFVLYVFSLATVPQNVDKYYQEHQQEFDEETKRTWKENHGLIYGLSFGYAVFIVICAGLSVFLNIYFWYVVLQAYKYIKAKMEAIAAGTYQASTGYGAPTTVVTYQSQPQSPAAYAQSYPAQPVYAPPAYAPQSQQYKA